MSGAISDPTGIAGIEVYADSSATGGLLDIGSATVKADGTWSIVDDNGPDTQTDIFAVATSGDGGTRTAYAPYDIQAGISGKPYHSMENLYGADGTFTSQAFFNRDGSLYQTSAYQVLPNGLVTYTYASGSAFSGTTTSLTDTYRGNGDLLFETATNTNGNHQTTAIANNQTLSGTANDTFTGPGRSETFALTPGFGADTIEHFALGGAQHDTLALSKTDFNSVSRVLAKTTEQGGGAVITDPLSGDTVTLAGVSKHELVTHHGDITLVG